jgi:hypothetical protein
MPIQLLKWPEMDTINQTKKGHFSERTKISAPQINADTASKTSGRDTIKITYG